MIDAYEFIQALNEASQPGDIINPSASGTTCQMILQTWKLKKGQRFCTNFVLGEMGAGLPYSIGAALATGKRVIHIEGDGGFQLNIQELETIRRLDLPIIMFVINNNGYHSIRLSQQAAFGRLTGADDTSGLTLPHVGSLGGYYRLDYGYLSTERSWISEDGGEYLFNFKSWKDAIPFRITNKTPLIFEVIADPTQQFRHRVKSTMVNGVMTTAPMNEVD